MTHDFDGYNFLVQLAMGERLSDTLEQFFAESKIKGGWVNGVGAASELRLGFYELSSKRYKWRTFDKPMEIVSLAGNIARHDQGKMMLHLHGVFADDEYRTIGGHVKDFVAGATVELFVQCWQKPLSRKYDDNTGLQLLDLVQ